MGVEQAAVEAMLDEFHPSLPSTLDTNNYTLGNMGIHNIVIAGMPEIGNNAATKVATQLLNDFRSIRFSLLVGIGGGVPDLSSDIDIRLGDVVVSKPSQTFGGVVQFDRGKHLSQSRFERTGMLQKPPDVLLATSQRLEAQHKRIDSDISNILNDMIERYPVMRRNKYVYQGAENDCLFQTSYQHHGGSDCRNCDPMKIVQRENRESTIPMIHYGTIGSSNTLIRDSIKREELKNNFGILCVDMEAAGLMNSFPCLVIRGICDYADSHKNKIWQPYAAATAAAYAKELIRLVPALDASLIKNSATDSIPQREIVIRAGNVGNLLNGPVSGDMVAGDKFHGNKVFFDAFRR